MALWVGTSGYNYPQIGQPFVTIDYSALGMDVINQTDAGQPPR